MLLTAIVLGDFPYSQSYFFLHYIHNYVMGTIEQQSSSVAVKMQATNNKIIKVERSIFSQGYTFYLCAFMSLILCKKWR